MKTSTFLFRGLRRKIYANIQRAGDFKTATINFVNNKSVSMKALQNFQLQNDWAKRLLISINYESCLRYYSLYS